MQTVAQGSHGSFHPYISRQWPLLWSLHGGLGISESLSQSLSLSCSQSLGLDFSIGLGLWLAELETLGDVDMGTFPRLG